MTGAKSGKVVMGNATSLWETKHPLVDADVGFAIGSCGSKVVMLDNGWGEGVEGEEHVFWRG